MSTKSISNLEANSNLLPRAFPNLNPTMGLSINQAFLRVAQHSYAPSSTLPSNHIYSLKFDIKPFLDYIVLDDCSANMYVRGRNTLSLTHLPTTRIGHR